MVPNDHIGTINDLKPSDIPYLEMSEKKGIDFISSKVENFDKNELVLGYHVPPFNSGWFSFTHFFLVQWYPAGSMTPRSKFGPFQMAHLATVR